MKCLGSIEAVVTPPVVFVSYLNTFFLLFWCYSVKLSYFVKYGRLCCHFSVASLVSVKLCIKVCLVVSREWSKAVEWGRGREDDVSP